MMLLNLSMKNEDSITGNARVQRGGGQGARPPENLKAIGFLSNTGLDPLKNHKATKPVFNVGRAIIGVSLAGR